LEWLSPTFVAQWYFSAAVGYDGAQWPWHFRPYSSFGTLCAGRPLRGEWLERIASIRRVTQAGMVSDDRSGPSLTIPAQTIALCR
jgi:hypothetical protein